MKSSVTAFGLASAVAASTIADFVPKCAVSCLESGVQSATSCNVEDLACVCIADNYRNTYTAALSCVLEACGSDTAIGEVLPGATHMCEVVLSSTFSSTAPTTAGLDSTTTTLPEATATVSTQRETTAVASVTPSDSASATAAAPSPTSSTAAAGSSSLQAGFKLIPSLLLAALAWV